MDNENNNDEKEIKQPLYKIVQHVTMYGMREENFYTLNTAVAHWESLTYLLASIWYQYDNQKKTWNIKDSYGTIKATQKIIDYMNKKYNNNQNNNHSPEKHNSQNSIMSFLSSFVNKDNNETHVPSEKQNIALLDEFFKFTELYTKKSGIVARNSLDNDDVECNDLIVSLVWSVGFQCYYLKSFEMAQQTWKSLGLWYSSVWFVRNAMGIFVVHDNFGTSDSVRRICRFVNDAQETWNYMKNKKESTQKRQLNDDIDSIIIGKEEKEICEEDDSKLCIVCLDGDRDHVIIPCGHICICVTCKELYGGNDAICPMCRGKVEKVIKTFN